MKNLFIYLFLLSIESLGQKGWLDLKTPQTEIIGKCAKYKNGEIDFNPIVPRVFSGEYEIAQGPNSKEEYNQYFRNLFTKYYQIDKNKSLEINSKNLVIKSLKLDDVMRLTSKNGYVYSGITADSVEIIVKTKKESTSNLSIINDLTKAINLNPAFALKIDQIIPLIDSVSYTRNDSISYRVTISNPNVFYKIKIIQFKQITKRNWNQYYKYWNSPSLPNTSGHTPPPSFKLIYTYDELNNNSNEIYPEFWGTRDNKQYTLKFRLMKEDNDLNLYIIIKNSSFYGSHSIKLSSKTIEGKKYWNLDQQFVDSFEFNKVIKLVYVTLRAKQLDENTVEVTNWQNLMDFNGKRTYLQYPEFKFKYLN